MMPLGIPREWGGLGPPIALSTPGSAPGAQWRRYRDWDQRRYRDRESEHTGMGIGAGGIGGGIGIWNTWAPEHGLYR